MCFCRKARIVDFQQQTCCVNIGNPRLFNSYLYCTMANPIDAYCSIDLANYSFHIFSIKRKSKTKRLV